MAYKRVFFSFQNSITILSKSPPRILKNALAKLNESVLSKGPILLLKFIAYLLAGLCSGFVLEKNALVCYLIALTLINEI